MRGICLYNPEKEEFIKIKDLDALVSEIIEDTSGNLWIATQGKGVLKYSPKQQTWKNTIKKKVFTAQTSIIYVLTETTSYGLPQEKRVCQNTYPPASVFPFP